MALDAGGGTSGSKSVYPSYSPLKGSNPLVTRHVSSTSPRTGASTSRRRRRSGGGGGGGNNRSEAARRRNNRNNNNNNNNRNRGGNNISYNNKGQATVKKAPAPPSLAQFLAKDTAYQGQVSDLTRALQQFMADLTQQRSTFQTGHADTKSRLGQEHERGLADIEADYASRGLLSSGLYGDAIGDYNNTYAQQLSDLDKQLAQSLQGLTSQQTNYQSEFEAAKKKAEQEAAARRAAQFGV